MKRVINHIRRWNKWRKGSLNSRFYKFLVLIGVKKSPTMPYVWLDSEWKQFAKGFRKGIIDGIKEINIDEIKVINESEVSEYDKKEV